MAVNISISEATEADLPDMVAVCCNSMEADILTRFLFGHQWDEAIRKQTESLTASLGKRFTHPTNRCYIVKAVDTQTGELIGWSLVKWEDGTWLNGNPVAPLNSDSDQPDFPMHYQQEVKRNWIKLMAGKPHVGKILALALELPHLKDLCSSVRSPSRKDRSTRAWDWEASCWIFIFEVWLGQRVGHPTD